MRIADPSKLTENQKQLLAKSLAKQTTARQLKPFKPFEIKIPMEVKSNNYWLKAHWSKRGKYSQDALSYLQIRGHTNYEPCNQKRHVTYTRMMSKGQRAFDEDNLIAGFKGIQDALKKAGIIKEDTPDWIEATYKQKRSDTNYPYMIIKVE